MGVLDQLNFRLKKIALLQGRLRDRRIENREYYDGLLNWQNTPTA